MFMVHHSGIQPESAIVAALHIELMARFYWVLWPDVSLLLHAFRGTNYPVPTLPVFFYSSGCTSGTI